MSCDLIWEFRARLILRIERGWGTQSELSLSHWTVPHKGSCVTVWLSCLFIGDAGDSGPGLLHVIQVVYIELQPSLCSAEPL